MSLSLRRLASLLGRGAVEDDTEGEVAGDDWPYEWTEERVERVHGEPVISHAAADDPEAVFAGPLARSMIEGPRENPDQPLYIGLGTRRGRHVGIEREYLFRHTCVFGTTGYGKSTLLKNAVKQVVESGHGCCFIDPKGQDSIELMQILPDDRLDDVVWIEPGQSRSAVAGFNFLEVGVGEDNPMYDTAVENVVGDLRRMIGADDYWGPLMDGVCSNLIRGTTRLDADFNLLDLYYILTDADARARYARMLEEGGLPWLADYAHKIEEMDDDDLDALQRRVKEWVEDPLARSTVAHRDTDIDIEHIVADGKILVVRMAEQDEGLKQMIGTAILRRIWSAVRSRAATYDTEYDPFFLFADEFDLIASQDSSVTTMLSKARSLSLALFLCCQQPSQLPDELVSAMYSNCDTCLSFSPGSPANARAVAKNLDMDPATLRHESNFHVWTQLTLSSTRERSEAFRTYTLPPFPPLRSVADAMHAIERTVRQYGREPLSDEEMRRGLILGGEGADVDLMPGDVQGETESGDTSLEFTEATERAAVQAVWDTMLRQDADAVPIDDVLPALRRRVASFDGDRQAAFQKLLRPAEAVSMAGGDKLTVSETDAETILTDIGTSRSNGGITHASLMWDAYAPLTKMGLDVTINRTGGTTADAVADPIPDPAEPELVERLTDGKEVRIEAESTTGDQQPGVTAHHICQAAEEGRRVLVLTRPDKAHRVENTLRNDPPLCNSGESTDGETWYYTSTAPITFSGNAVCRPGGSRNVWVREHSSGDIVLRDTSGTEWARFEEPAGVFQGPEPYPRRGENRVIAPVIPDAYEFDTDSPADEATIVEVPNGASELADLSIERYPTDPNASATGGVTIPDHTEPLVELLEAGESISKPAAGERLAEHGHDVHRATVHRWMDALLDAGVLHETDATTDTGATVLHVSEAVAETAETPAR